MYYHATVWNQQLNNPDSKVRGANTWSTWVLSAPDGPRVGPTNLAIREMSSLVDVIPVNISIEMPQMNYSFIDKLYISKIELKNWYFYVTVYECHPK